MKYQALFGFLKKDTYEKIIVKALHGQIQDFWEDVWIYCWFYLIFLKYPDENLIIWSKRGIQVTPEHPLDQPQHFKGSAVAQW